jgi:hypothetical protein
MFGGWNPIRSLRTLDFYKVLSNDVPTCDRRKDRTCSSIPLPSS